MTKYGIFVSPVGIPPAIGQTPTMFKRVIPINTVNTSFIF